MISIYVTYPDLATAKKISNQLIEENLIACANISEHISLYKWDGELIDEAEFSSWLKAPSQKWELIQKRIKELHPYDIPCIIKFNVEAFPAYTKWVNNSTNDMQS